MTLHSECHAEVRCDTVLYIGIKPHSIGYAVCHGVPVYSSDDTALLSVTMHRESHACLVLPPTLSLWMGENAHPI